MATRNRTASKITIEPSHSVGSLGNVISLKIFYKVWGTSKRPISAMEWLRWAFSISTTWLQKALSSNNNNPTYSLPRCSMVNKHVEYGGTWDDITSRSIPTSPFGLVLSSPLLHIHTGGQLRTPLYIIKGWSRRNIGSFPNPLTWQDGLGRLLCC